MARYVGSYRGTAAEPGWTGGGTYPGWGYRTEGYHARHPVELRPRYDREIRPRGLGSPPSQPQHRWPAPRAYAADPYGGGHGPSYYTGGLYGRERRRR